MRRSASRVFRPVVGMGSPTISPATRRTLDAYARSAAIDAAKEDWEREQYPLLALGALRALVAASPDYQTS